MGWVGWGTLRSSKTQSYEPLPKTSRHWIYPPTDTPSVIFDFPSITLRHRPWFPFLSCCCPSLPECPPPLSPLHSMTSRPSPYSRHPWSPFPFLLLFLFLFLLRKLGQKIPLFQFFFFRKTGTKIWENRDTNSQNVGRMFRKTGTESIFCHLFDTTSSSFSGAAYAAPPGYLCLEAYAFEKRGNPPSFKDLSLFFFLRKK